MSYGSCLSHVDLSEARSVDETVKIPFQAQAVELLSRFGNHFVWCKARQTVSEDGKGSRQLSELISFTTGLIMLLVSSHSISLLKPKILWKTIHRTWTNSPKGADFLVHLHVNNELKWPGTHCFKQNTA